MSFTPLKVARVQTVRSMDAASGDVPYTGVGFKPKMIICMGQYDAGAKSISNGGAVAGGNGGGCIFLTNLTSIPSSGRRSSICITLIDGAAQTNKQEAALKSVDDDGFTLTWTKTGSPTAANSQLQIFCIG